MRAYQTRARPVSFAEWSRLPESNWLHRGTSPAHRRQCLGDKERLEPALGIKPKSHAYRARALPLSYTGWRPVRESNPLLDVTNVAHRHQCVPALERVTGVEPVSTAWRAAILAAGRHSQKMERVARVELASLVWKTRAPAAIPYPLGRGGGTCTRLKWLMRPCWNYLQSTPQNEYSIVKDLVGAAGFEPANLLRPRQAAFHLPTPRRLDISESNRESLAAKVIGLD
jgi:hypothetical protein